MPPQALRPTFLSRTGTPARGGRGGARLEAAPAQLQGSGPALPKPGLCGIGLKTGPFRGPDSGPHIGTVVFGLYCFIVRGPPGGPKFGAGFWSSKWARVADQALSKRTSLRCQRRAATVLENGCAGRHVGSSPQLEAARLRPKVRQQPALWSPNGLGKIFARPWYA